MAVTPAARCMRCSAILLQAGVRYDDKATGTAGGTAMKRKQRKRLIRQLATIDATLQEIADAVREIAMALSERPAPEPDQPTDGPRLQ